MVLLSSLGATLGIYKGIGDGDGVSCDYYTQGLNLVSLHVQGGTTSKIVRWLTANTLASLGDTNLAYVANDISTDKGLVGTSKIIAVVG